MNNKLFIVCPFSCVENKLKRKYGSNSFFISSPGAIIPYNDHLFIEVLMGEIVRNDISEIYFVNDASSRIINSVILNKDLFGLDAEYLVKSIYKNSFSKSFKGRTNQYQQFRLAELVVQNQKIEFLTNDVFTDLLIDRKIVVKTLVLSSSMRLLKESNIASLVKVTYEL